MWFQLFLTFYARAVDDDNRDETVFYRALRSGSSSVAHPEILTLIFKFHQPYPILNLLQGQESSPNTVLHDCEGEVRRGTLNICDLAGKLVEERAIKIKAVV